jgi:hypothetical protein
MIILNNNQRRLLCSVTTCVNMNHKYINIATRHGALLLFSPNGKIMFECSIPVKTTERYDSVVFKIPSQKLLVWLKKNNQSTVRIHPNGVISSGEVYLQMETRTYCDPPLTGIEKIKPINCSPVEFCKVCLLLTLCSKLVRFEQTKQNLILEARSYTSQARCEIKNSFSTVHYGFIPTRYLRTLMGLLHLATHIGISLEEQFVDFRLTLTENGVILVRVFFIEDLNRSGS